MKQKKILTLEHLLKRAKHYKKESPEEFEQRLNEFEVSHGNKFKEIAKQLSLPTIVLNNLAEKVGVTESIFKSFQISNLILSRIKTQLANIEKINSFLKITKISMNIFPNIDWEKVNAYVLIEELKAEGINPLIINEIDIKQLSDLRKEAERINTLLKINLSIVETIKDSAEFKDKIDYDYLSNMIASITKEIENQKIKELVIRTAQKLLSETPNTEIISPKTSLDQLTPTKKRQAITILQEYANGCKSREEISINLKQKHNINLSPSTIRDVEELIKEVYEVDTKEQMLLKAASENIVKLPQI